MTLSPSSLVLSKPSLTRMQGEDSSPYSCCDLDDQMRDMLDLSFRITYKFDFVQSPFEMFIPQVLPQPPHQDIRCQQGREYCWCWKHVSGWWRAPPSVEVICLWVTVCNADEQDENTCENCHLILHSVSN